MESNALNANEAKTLLQAIERLDSKVSALATRNLEDPYESRETKELNTAMAKAYAEYPVIGTNRQNAYFKDDYADLNVIMTKIRPILAKNGITLTQRTIVSNDGATMLHTRIWHISGQWMETRARVIPTKNDPKTYASLLSYIKRYQAMAILNITVIDDVNDDDAELEMAHSRDILAKGTAVNKNYKQSKESSQTISKQQLEELEYELGEYTDIAEMLMDAYRIQSLADLPKSKYRVAITKAREIKEARKGH
jgi:hypothetical protein